MGLDLYKIGRQLSTTIGSILIVASSIIPVSAHELGLQLFSVRHQMEQDVNETFAEINQWGLKVVEGGGALYGNSIDTYRNYLIANNLEMASVDASYEELRDNPIAVAYKARFFGSRYATFYWIPHDGNKPFDFETTKAAVAVMNKAGKLLQEQGITLQYHPHGYEFHPHENGNLLDYMIQNTQHAQFQMDVFWMKQAGMDPTKLLQQYPGRFTSLHLKDRLKGTPNSKDGSGDKESNVILGEGDVGIASVVAEAKKQGIRYFFLEDESSRVMQQIPKSISFLNKLDGRAN
jgi:sugar phosphate isomerase/epimerase